MSLVQRRDQIPFRGRVPPAPLGPDKVTAVSEVQVVRRKNKAQPSVAPPNINLRRDVKRLSGQFNTTFGKINSRTRCAAQRNSTPSRDGHATRKRLRQFRLAGAIASCPATTHPVSGLYDRYAPLAEVNSEEQAIEEEVTSDAGIRRQPKIGRLSELCSS